jgi:acyl-CoA reductase-like NAD-dependent aldehyde dehydrogenase
MTTRWKSPTHRIRSHRRRLFQESRKNQESQQEAFHVSNLYLNRKCTGAMVGAHPFGGFNMSGTDSRPAEKIICCFSCKPNP